MLRKGGSPLAIWEGAGPFWACLTAEEEWARSGLILRSGAETKELDAATHISRVRCDPPRKDWAPEEKCFEQVESLSVTGPKPPECSVVAGQKDNCEMTLREGTSLGASKQGHGDCSQSTVSRNRVANPSLLGGNHA